MVRPLGLSSSIQNTVYEVMDLSTSESVSKTLPKHLPQAPRSVQSGFTHRLRDGKNHIYLTISLYFWGLDVRYKLYYVILCFIITSTFNFFNTGNEE
jgi:hypothetical protein